MKIYVAGASAEIERCEAFIGWLRAHGFEIAFDWPAHVREAGAANGPTLTEVQRAKAADACLEGAASIADVFVLLEPTAPTVGAWVELGAVLSRDEYVALWVGSGVLTIMSSLVTARVDFDRDALAWLLGYRAAQDGPSCNLGGAA